MTSHMNGLGFVAMSLSCLAVGCGGGSMASGGAVGRLGSGLATHSRAVPQGAEVCAMQIAVSPPTPGAPEKPVSETCAKALNSDLLWRRSMIVLAAYAQKLESLASGEKPETAGQLEGTLTGVRGENWIDAEPGTEQSAKDAAAKLVSQMMDKETKRDFATTVKDAAPHVRALCDGLKSYLDAQATKFADLEQDMEKKRAAKSDRRCASVDGKSICVSESVIDRVVYATTFSGLAMQTANHLEARDDVASFCAAHAKLEGGDASKAETYAAVVDAVKAVPRASPPRAAPPPAAKK